MDVNDLITIKGDNALGAFATFNLTVPQGTYDLPALDSMIKTLLSNAGAKTSPDHLVDFLANDALQKVQLKFNYSNVVVEIPTSQSFKQIIGFTSQTTYSGYQAGHIETADQVADFAQIQSYLLHTNLTNLGMRINNRYSQVVAQIQIDTDVGSQINFSPNHSAKVNASNLIGQSISVATLSITDQEDRDVVLVDPFTCRLVIKYTV